MKLSAEQRKFLRDESGVIANEACDSCGKVLGCVRFTRRGELGEWCSRECRDGLDAATKASQRIERKAKSGRPRLYEDNAAKCRAYRRRSATQKSNAAI